MYVSKLRQLIPLRTLSQLGSPLRTAMTDTMQAGVATTESWPLSVKNINQNLVTAQYAVRGEIVQLAQQITAELKAGKEFPFKKIVMCNIGNPQQLGQKPITFFRQVVACCEYPEDYGVLQLMDLPNASEIFPSDVIARAKRYLAAIGSTGAYSDSLGAAIFREDIAGALLERDGYPADVNCIFMTDGASPSVHRTVEMLTRSPNDAFLTPIPQYPLYSASLALHGAHLLPYYLDEEHSWGLDMEHLRSQCVQARKEGKTVRALVVINPGNPTGGVLSRENQNAIVKFCEEEKLVLIADEVYQTNIYADGKEFTSFKEVVRAAESGIPVVSMNSTSKGFFGECGRRGGYFELVNFAEEVRAELYKGASINLCSNLPGQITMTNVMCPPKVGEPSYELFVAERDGILESLKRRARIMVDALSKLEGVTCNDTEGALYVFPRVTLPDAAVQAAKEMGKAPDFLYCKALLEATGIVTVPGSGFQQAPGTFHFRTTILPPENDIEAVAELLSNFHKSFIAKYK